MQKPVKRPNAEKIQAIHNLLQTGQWAVAEKKARTLLQAFPNELMLYNCLGMSQQQQGNLPGALFSFQRILGINPRIAEIHFNIAVLQAQLGQTQAAITSYRQALNLKPDFTVGHFNLGTLLQAQGLLAEAAWHYQKAVALQPDFFEALGNYGAVLQLQGHLEAAAQCYRQALALKSDARSHFNLATALHDQGHHADAIVEFRNALTLEPQFADAWNDLGETHRDQGDMIEAVRCYRQALHVEAGHARALYNLGEFHCLDGQLHEAITYFEQSHFADAPARALQCLYKTEQFDRFERRLGQLSTQAPHHSILIGTLSTHYASNFRVADRYDFCQEPMNYVMHTRIDALAQGDSLLLENLLHDIQHLAIAERKQGRLYYGMQSAGNLLQRGETSIQQLATLLKAKINDYRQQFAFSPYQLIQAFPNDIDFTSSWYLRMNKGGYLTSHIHEEGWISGCVYLKLPEKNNGHEGSFEYSTDGDDYPRLHDDFPRHIVDQQVGDLVLFPSSLFHRTLPFHSDQERVCVAFDVKPAPSVLLPQS
ncbi:MAG: tetratricopeptide repeat protein [Methylomonas sp.]|nr:tetratricopeptide repeat protein [Methylomonas sp.]PPD21554.1 MAG: hypothetical protein CTY23_05175 [Methylomonas sp.]PPD24936.1 MAG: hypothetical protein CTY22_10155 [Methylomonas sp.]PPD34101.1 MAG: hypothetical protein CTY21_10135 [Methylomonas sp.]PPD40489.1 MAG: hypothetical protein CTY17_06270 [Methylomonas sp.]